MPVIYRMSHVGACPRALSAERLNLIGEQQPDWLQTTADEGKLHEEWTVEKLKSEHIFVGHRQKEIKLTVSDNIELVGHIDGLILKSNDNYEAIDFVETTIDKLLEIKSMSQFEFDRWYRGQFDEFPQYKAQLTCYMTALNLTKALYIVKNRNNGYIDRREITSTPMDINNIFKKLIEVEEYVSQGKLYPADYDSTNVNCRRCVYKHYCIEPVHVTEQELPVLLAAVANWRKGTALVKEGESLQAEAKDTFMQHTLATNKDKWTFEHLAFNLIQANGFKYDKEMLKEYLTEDEYDKCVIEYKREPYLTVREMK